MELINKYKAWSNHANKYEKETIFSEIISDLEFINSEALDKIPNVIDNEMSKEFCSCKKPKRYIYGVGNFLSEIIVPHTQFTLNYLIVI